MGFQITQVGLHDSSAGVVQVQHIEGRWAFGVFGERPMVWCSDNGKPIYGWDEAITGVHVEPKFKVGELVLVNFTASDLHQHYGTVDAVEESGVVAVMFFGMDRPLGFLQDNLVPITLPAPLPAGFRLKPRNVKAATGDMAHSKHSPEWQEVGWSRWLTAEEADSQFGEFAPYFFAEPIPKPADNRPDPGEGWRLLEDDEVIAFLDQRKYTGLANDSWTTVMDHWVGDTVRRRKVEGLVVRRRIPETWTPTSRFQDRVLNRDNGGPFPNGTIHRVVDGEWKFVVREQLWTCGEREDWRVPEATKGGE